MIKESHLPPVSCRYRLERIMLDLKQVDHALDSCDEENTFAVVSRVHRLQKKFDNIINTLNDLDEHSASKGDDNRVAAVLSSFKRVISRYELRKS